MLNKHFIWLPMAALALSLAGQAALYRSETPTAVLHASWAFAPKSLQEAGGRATAVFEGEVVRVDRGEDIVTATPGEPGDQDRIPTQRVTLKVGKTVKGVLKEGELVQLFQTGGVVNLPKVGADGPLKDDVHVAGAKVVVLEGDPLYSIGEQHLVIAEAGPKGFLRTVSPEGAIESRRTARSRQQSTTSSPRSFAASRSATSRSCCSPLANSRALVYSISMGRLNSAPHRDLCCQACSSTSCPSRQ